jgi:hypothetical protein
MRKSASFLIPATLITIYYIVWIGVVVILLTKFPAVRDFFPVGGIGELAGRNLDSFEPVYSGAKDIVIGPNAAFRLLFASIGAAAMIIPVSWVYFITSPTKEVDQSFAQTIVIMPIVVTGIATIVQVSIALAFSLAGIVAAVRFRFSLKNPSHAMYIFAAIGIGLGSGISALGVATVISMAFVYANLIIWKLEYGRDMSGSFLSMLTRRNRSEDEY